MRKHLLVVLFFVTVFLDRSIAQDFLKLTKPAKHWVDSTFRKMNKKDKIAQLMVIRALSTASPEQVDSMAKLITQYNIGGLCFFQGGPIRQALQTNYYQGIAKIPMLISIDAEWGLGMRLDSVINFPRQLMLGASQDAQLSYITGRAIGEQCKRLGIHMNYAPDVDVNNNPDNPVINDRSFGENKYKVSLYGSEMMKGMQDVNVIATAKHFPGHGDVAVDSHLDLPVINKTRGQLDSLELYPFRELINKGIGSVMIAHLAVPSLDTTSNQPTSLSPKAINGLLKDELGFTGLTVTDALEMKGVTKYYPAGQASLQSLIAGNDLLCLPGDIPGSIDLILHALKKRQLRWKDINGRVKKILLAKYNLGLNHFVPIDTAHLITDLNIKTIEINQQIAQKAITLVRQTGNPVPLQKGKKIAYLSIGLNNSHILANRLKNDCYADIYSFQPFTGKNDSIKETIEPQPGTKWNDSKANLDMASALLKKIMENGYDEIIIGLHHFNRRPANNFGIANSSLYLITQLQQSLPSVTLVFGNPYAIKNFCSAPNILECYEDDDITQSVAADWLQGKIQAKGLLPVTVCEHLPYGTGILYNNYFPPVVPETVHVNSKKLEIIDSIANDAISNKAFPGCVVLAAKDGKIIYHKAFGYTNYDKTEPVTTATVYDLASVTKVSATTVSIMKLIETGKINIDKTLGDYLEWTRGSDKAGLKIKDILLHQAGLTPYLSFYQEVIDKTTGEPNWSVFSRMEDDHHRVRVSEGLYLRNDWEDTLKKRIIQSKLSASGHYVYSDNDFIFLGKIVETVSGKPLDRFVKETFYEPLQMTSTGFKPRETMPIENIAPTELEKHFRNQLLRGDVHDEGAAMFGEVAGHAGLFSNAYDLSQLYQLLLNGGEINGIRLLNKSTIDTFTAYNSNISRRGLGFDKPEKDNASRKDPYPCKSASPETFGHTGFTGTCVWADPKSQILFIFLSNRVTPTRDDNKISQMNIRPKIQEAIYNAIMN